VQGDAGTARLQESFSPFSEGFVSWRDKVSGSWYVETLDSVLEHYARSEDLLTMLLRVNVFFFNLIFVVLKQWRQ